VLIQEIFGVTDHIRALADGFAEDGYETLAPSFYDRQQRDFAATYGAEDVARARQFSEAAPWDEVAGDLTAAIRALKPPVFVVGYGWGGTSAWLAACRCDGVAAVSAFHGRRIPELLDETPRCPILLHFGRKDGSIPPAVVESIAAKHPEMPIYMYDARHSFVSDRRDDYNADCAKLSRLRTLQVFAMYGAAHGDI
jgi:carboxymethylenebutenolidase